MKVLADRGDTPGGTATALSRTELRLITASARSTLTPAEEEYLAGIVQHEIDWVAVMKAGLRHGVLPLMYTHLRQRAEVPEETRSALRERWEYTARCNLYLSTQLFDTVDALAGGGIPTIALKGPALAVALYSSLSLREFGDLDLLVRREDVPQAVKILRDRGFEPWKEPLGAQDGVVRRFEYSRSFTRRSDDIDLDLHWEIAKGFFKSRFNSDVLWKSGEVISIHGREIRGLPPFYMLLLLAVHGAKHGPFPWPRIKWICDMAEFTRAYPDFDWPHALRVSEEFRCRRMLLLGLALAAELMDGLPPPVQREVEAAPRVRSLANRIWQWMLSDEEVILSFADRTAVDLSLRDRYSDRVVYLARRVFQPAPRDWGTLELPRRLAFLYFPIRIGRLVAAYVSNPRRLSRLLRSNRDDAHRS